MNFPYVVVEVKHLDNRDKPVLTPVAKFAYQSDAKAFRDHKYLKETYGTYAVKRLELT